MSTPAFRDHGGDLGVAVARFGGDESQWIDLSTGINQSPYPLPDLPPEAWRSLPTRRADEQLIAAARAAYCTNAAVLPLAGAQAAIQLVPRLVPPGRAAVLGPTYNEHAAALRTQGWQVDEAHDLEALRGAAIAIVVNPNNPDGRVHSTDALMALADQVGLLVVDESFADAMPSVSIAARASQGRLLVLRSFGKFYGLAGLRLGFALGQPGTIAILRELAGPWAVSGPALAIGAIALGDTRWADETRTRLSRDGQRLVSLAVGAGWRHAGGTPLFALFATSNAAIAQERLARHRIWSRTFPWSSTLIRLGTPADDRQWRALERALGDP